MADAGTPLIRAEDRLASPSGATPEPPLPYPGSGGRSVSPNRSPNRMSVPRSAAAGAGAGAEAPLSPPNRSRVELAGGSNVVLVGGYQSVSSDRVSPELGAGLGAVAPGAPGSVGGAAASVSRGRQGRRRSSNSRASVGRALLAGLLPGGGDDDRAFVALDVREQREVLEAQRWRSTVPEDVLVHSFSFLTPAELATVSTVSRSWSHASYEPSLWTHMDLSGLYLRVDDAFLIHLLGSQRFVHLRFLSLEGCSAITNKSIRALMHYCPNLRELRLTDCTHITNPWLFPELVKCMPFLRRLELYGCFSSSEFGIVQPMLEARPKLDLGLFWLEYCAENGIKCDGSGLADCRYEEGGDAAEVGGAAPARAAGAGGANQRGCWGRVKGRIVFASNFYHRGGNYPRMVLYACENHRESDFADPAFHRCHVCEQLFAGSRRPGGGRGASMVSDLICKVCFDKENLQNRRTWIPLDEPSIKSFGLSDIVSKTIHVASRKNLPVSLRSFGTTPCRLDYNLPEPVQAELEEGEEEEEEHEGAALIPRIGHVGLGLGLGLGGGAAAAAPAPAPVAAPAAGARGVGARAAAAAAAGARAGAARAARGGAGAGGGRGLDHAVVPAAAAPLDEDEHKQSALVERGRIDPSAVPMSTFVRVNGWRVDESVHQIRAHLRTAFNGFNTRALLVYDAQDNIEVLADKRVILDGREGEESLQLTVQAWHSALEILYPILIVMILSLHFGVLYQKQDRPSYSGRTNYKGHIVRPQDQDLSVTLYVIIALVVFAAVMLAAVLFHRFREQCERCFKRFLVADILLILMFGVATLVWLLCTQWRLYLDAVTFAFIVWNASLTGLLTLYYPMPERMHHACLLLLNSVMAILLNATLPVWLILLFLFLAAAGDILSELRPNARLLSPFIIPANVELIYNTPKVLYTVSGLRLRAADLLWYGLLTALAVKNVASGDTWFQYADVLLGGAICVVCVLAALALLLFVAPFVGYRTRPLPLAILAAFVLTMMQEKVLEPYIRAQNSMDAGGVSFE